MIWFDVLLPAFTSTGGIATVLSCRVCGASVTVTQQDERPASDLHIAWHLTHGEKPPPTITVTVHDS